MDVIPIYFRRVSVIIIKFLINTPGFRFDWRDVPGMCHRNSAVAASVGRKDLVQAWTLAALAATPPTQSASDLDEDFPWGPHPLAKDMIQSL